MPAVNPVLVVPKAPEANDPCTSQSPAVNEMEVIVVCVLGATATAEA